MIKPSYYSLNNYIKATFGEKLYKLSLNGGFTCPNRDGSLDTRGCIFCSKGGSGDFASSANLSITDQIEEAKSRVISKMPKNGMHKYIAYFQAFTNTYAEISVLRSTFMEAIKHPDIAALSIATRPDCLPLEVLNLLKELNQIKPVWVELGLQTIHPETSAYIRRGYSLDVYDTAVRSLKEIGISQIVTHIILGLPGESTSMMLDTVRHAVNMGTTGIKLQLLHVIKDTDLAKDYYSGAFNTLSMEEYVDIVVSCIEIIPNNIVIHRITGDGDKKTLIAPLWSANKKCVLNALSKRLTTI